MSNIPMYHEGSRQLQDQFQTRKLADRLVEVLAREEFTEDDRAFIESRPLFFLATADAEGHPDCSHKGGLPGFVRVVDRQTIAFPSYDGNGMFKSLGNLLVNPHVGLLFIDFESPRRLRVNGQASVHADDPLLGEFVGAQLMVRVRAEAISPTAPGTSTGCRSSSNRFTRPVKATRRPSRNGSSSRSSGRCCHRAIRLPTRLVERIHARCHQVHSRRIRMDRASTTKLYSMDRTASVSAPGSRNTASTQNGKLPEDLGALQSSIRDASVHELNDPNSDCRVAIDVLVNFAAAPGPTGDNARTALRDLYTGSIGPEKRNALLNAAHDMNQKTLAGDSLSATVIFMGGVSPSSPEGSNGPGHIHAANALLASKLGWPLDLEPNLLAEDRVVTNTERQAAGAQLKNLNWSEPASVATPEAARSSFERMLSDVAIHQKTITVWVADADGQCVPVVAQPTSSGGIRFHVIAQDEAGNEVGKKLEELSDDDCVVVHQVDDTHIALKHLDANFHDERGAGGVLREHADGWSDMSAADQAAARLMSRAENLEAVAADRASNPQAPREVYPLAPKTPHSAPAPKPRSCEDNFNRLGLTKQAGRVHSALDDIQKAVGLDRQQHEPDVSTERYVALGLASPIGLHKAARPELDNFYYPARAFARGFNETKAPLLFKAASPGHPLASVSATLRDFRSGEHVVELTINYQKKLLQDCCDAASRKDLTGLKNALDEIAAVQADLMRTTDKAIADLEGLSSPGFSLETPELTAQAKAEAKSLIEALKQYRECLTAESRDGGNAYADLVAFAKEATRIGPNLEVAQKYFQGVGNKPHTVAAPVVALRAPLPDVIKLPEAVPIAMQVEPAAPRPSSPDSGQTPAQRLANQNLRVIAKPSVDDTGIPRASFHVESPASSLALALNSADKMNDPNPRISQGAKLDYARAMTDVGPWGIDDGYIQKAWKTMGTFAEMQKRPWRAGPASLTAAGVALNTVAGSVGSVQFATRRAMLLDAAYKAASKGDRAGLKKIIEELTSTERAFFANIDGARTALNNLVEPSQETSRDWKEKGVKDKEAGQIRNDADILLGALDDMEALARHQIFADFKDAFYDSTEESLTALTQHFRDIGHPSPPEPAEFSARASAAGFGESSKPDSNLAKAMAHLKTVQEKPATRSVFGRPIDKKSGRLAQLGSVSSPDKLDEVLNQAVVGAGAVDGAPNRTVAMGALYAKVADAKRFAEQQLDGIYDSIKMLKDFENSSATKAVKADAKEMRVALESLGAEWEKKTLQIVAFAELGAVYPQEAYAALTGLGAAR